MWRYCLNLIVVIGITVAEARDYPIYHVDKLCHCENNNTTYELGVVESSSSALKLRAMRNHMCKSSINCTIHILPPTNHGIILNFMAINLPQADVCLDYIKLYDVGGTNANHIICQDNRVTYVERAFHFTQGITLLYHVEHLKHKRKRDNVQGFELAVSSYDEYPCSNNTFRCFNRRCISEWLRCDNVNNCGDNSDEGFYLCEYVGRSNIVTMILLAFGVMVTVSLLTAFLIVMIPCRCSSPRTISKEQLIKSMK